MWPHAAPPFGEWIDRCGARLIRTLNRHKPCRVAPPSDAGEPAVAASSKRGASFQRCDLARIQLIDTNKASTQMRRDLKVRTKSHFEICCGHDVTSRCEPAFERADAIQPAQGGFGQDGVDGVDDSTRAWT
jgi:hypothetical protein